MTAASRGTGWFAAPNEIFDRDDLSAFERLVFLYLCRCLGPDGRAWPSYQRIAASCGISRRAAIDAVRGLVDKGLITVQPRRDAAGDPATNVYQLRVGRGGATGAPPGVREELGGASDAPGSAGHAPPSAPDAPGVVQEVHQGGAPGAPEGYPLNNTHEKDKGRRTSSSSPDGADGTPSLRRQIAELVAHYRQACAAQQLDRDYAFMGRLYQTYPIDRIYEAIDQAALQIAAGQDLEDPLRYIAGILRQNGAAPRAGPRRESRRETPIDRKLRALGVM